MKITALEESADFATLDTAKLFSKLKSYELSRNGCLNHDASLISKLFLLLLLMLVAMLITPPTLLTHLLWSLSCPLWPQLLMSSTRASPMTRSPCWRGSSALCTGSVRRGGEHRGAASGVMTPPNSSPTTPSGRSSTPLTSTTTTTGMTPATRVRARKSTASGRRRSSKR
jgi:hypothetical protein